MHAINQPGSARRSRSDAVDFCRGLALLIIFINHIPFNEVSLYTPSRFGFSDAAEIFIYCSGLVSALVFGCCLQQAGVWLGTVRVLHRCGQIYLAHLGLFITVAIVCVLGNAWLTHTDYIDRLNLRYFFDQTPEALVGLASLTYVPNYFDILPMYLVILLWVPVVWTLAQGHRSLGLLFPLLLYAAMWCWGWELPADPRSDRPWFFNPFAWQLLFFTGFAFGSGWLRIAPGRVGLTRLAWAIVILAIPLAYEPVLNQSEGLRTLRASLTLLLDKTHFGLLRGLHFLALAYLAYSWLQRHPDFLQRLPAVWIRKAGEHSLPVFFLGMNLSYVAGMILDEFGHGVVVLAWVNLGGCALLIAVAYQIAWLNTKPWQQRAGATAGPRWDIGTGMAPSVARRWQFQAIRLVSTSALLLTLSVAPLYLVNKYVMSTPVPLQMSDSTSVLKEWDMPAPESTGAGSDSNQEEQELEENEPTSS